MGRAFYIVDEEHLRDKVLELIPELRRETEREADLIRELVKLEREKAGLDHPGGALSLWLNKDKRKPDDPQWIGTGRVAGRHYLVSAWQENDKLQIALKARK